MTSLSILKVLDTYTDLFQRKSRFPLEWDKKRQRLVYVSNGKLSVSFYFKILVVVLTSGLGLFLNVRQIFYKERIMPLWIMLINLGVTLLGLLTLVTFYLSSLNGVKIVHCFNELLNMMVKISIGKSFSNFR